MRIEEGSVATAKVHSAESMTTSCGSLDDDAPSSTDYQSPAFASIPVDECVYRGEGNANLVIALLRERKVIRFRKSLPGEVSPDGGKLRVHREQEFARSLVTNFFGSYLRVPEIQHCDSKDIARLTELFRTLRPDRRQQKEIREVYATRLPDYTFLRAKLEPDLVRNKSTFCVEIKPKQGHLAKGEHRFQKCPYCLHQYYKMRKGAIIARSTYCPFDLFSGEAERMKSAIKGLLSSPQNNLKIFKDGVVVYDQESSPKDLERVLLDWFRNYPISSKEDRIDRFCELIRAALLSSFGQEELLKSTTSSHKFLVLAREDPPQRLCHFSELVAKAKKILYFAGEECTIDTSDSLPKDSVLARILLMQRLPYVGTDYIYSVYSKYAPVLSDELIYANLIKPLDCQANNKANILSENSEISKLGQRLSIRSNSMSKRFRFEGNCHGNGYSIVNSMWSANEELINITSRISKSLSDTSYVEKYDIHSYNSGRILNGDGTNCSQEQKDAISRDDIVALQNYLLFSTARDCSILMAFQELNTNGASTLPYENIIKTSEDQYFFCDIGVSDLDPKSFHCIEKHRKRDIGILNAVISMLEEELAQKNQSRLEKRLSAYDK